VQYYQVIERKTAVLFQAACQIGGVLAEVDSATEKALKNFGLHLGYAFQIIDDVLDYESNFETMGKEVGDDLSEGKTTLPMIFAMKNTTGKEKSLLEDAINNADNSEIKTIIQILTRTKSFEYTRQKAQESVNLAKQSLSILPDSAFKNALLLLGDLSLKRQS
jgi:octaprenyl-diphosphate synthase